MTYGLTRFLILRLLGVVYACAFLVLAFQLGPLIGADGLTPAGLFLDRVRASAGSTLAGFREVPTVFWWRHGDGFMVGLAWTGVALSLLVAAGPANGVGLAALWALYLSFVHVGQDWYAYGWEIQLLETGFLAVFLAPPLDPRPFPRSPAPEPILWLFRWLIARIMLGAAFIKLRGDPCWRDLTCLVWHYETQPIPNPLSPLFHFLPAPAHRLGALFMYLAELVAPCFAFGPARARVPAGLVMIAFQLVLVASGNLSFLNWLTIVPALACLDDRQWRRVLPARLVAAADRTGRSARLSPGRTVATWTLVALVAALSVDPLVNLLSSRQIMNTSFDRLHLVNTYGAFGTVGRERLQLVFEGTEAARPGPGAAWKPYDFKCQPGPVDRRPCVCSPYHYRLDWAVWFAAMASPERYPWTLHLVWKLLHNDPVTLSLLAGNPFPGRPPGAIRVRLFRYRFAPLSHPGGVWWERDPLGVWLPPLSADDPRLVRFLSAYGWLSPASTPNLI